MGSYCSPGFSTHSIKSAEDVSIDPGLVCEVCLMLIGHATDHNHKDRWFKSKRWWIAMRPRRAFTLFAVVFFSALYERKLPNNGEVTAGIVILTCVNKWHHYRRVTKRQTTDSIFILIKRWAARTNVLSYEEYEICLFWQCISAYSEWVLNVFGVRIWRLSHVMHWWPFKHPSALKCAALFDVLT